MARSFRKYPIDWTRPALSPWVKAVAFAFVVPVFPSLAREASADHPGNEVVERWRVNCGPNALLLFLTLLDTPVGDDLIDSIKCTSDGASLLQLRDACSSVGIATDVRIFPERNALAVPLPAIAQAPNGNGKHHYYVWYHVSDDFVYALDSTSGQRFRIRKGRLADFWTGYALVPHCSLVHMGGLSVERRCQLVWLLSLANLGMCIFAATIARGNRLRTFG